MPKAPSPLAGAFSFLNHEYTPHEIEERPEIRRSRITATSQAAILRLLVDGPHSIKELVEETGVSRQTITGYITHLRKKKLVHVQEWIKLSVGVRATAFYRFAPDKKDAKRPPAMTQAEKDQRYRTKKKQRDAAMLITNLGGTYERLPSTD